MSTYLSLHYHIVFSTKHREPRISDTWIKRLHEYLGGTAKGWGDFHRVSAVSPTMFIS